MAETPVNVGHQDNVFVAYVRSTHPTMRASSIVQGDHWRIGILTESLIRFEWSDSGEFEDNPTQMVVSRDFGAQPRFTVTHRNGFCSSLTPRPCTLHMTANRSAKKG